MKQSKEYYTLLKNMAAEWKWLWKFIKKYKLILIAYILIGLLSTAMALSVSIFSKFLIDSVIMGEKALLLKYGIIVISLAVFQHVFSAASAWVISLASSKVNNEIRAEVYSHIMTAKWQDISTYQSGDLINRLESDVSAVSNGAINFIPSLLIKLVQFLGALSIVLYYDKMMALLALASAPFLFLSSKILVKTIRKYNKKSRELNGEVLSFTEESVRNVQLIKSFDLTKKYISDFGGILENYRSVRLSYDKFSILMSLVLSLVGVAVSYSCYGLGVYRLWQGAITFGTMTMFLQLSGTLTSSFGAIASMIPSAISIATAASRVMEVTNFSEETDSDMEKAFKIKELSQKNGISLCIEKLSFSYEKDSKRVLNDITLTAKPGDIIALTGQSGEGKTTLLKLILGLVSAQSGEIYITAGDERLAVSESTRRFCTYVPQTMDVFSQTIRENLKIVKPDATDEELYKALKTADLYDFVIALPEGLDTFVNQSGNNFSQGQLQRLSIARALLRESEIFIMDEATSALDVKTEEKVLSNIMASQGNRICIVTTHRASMLKYCNKVYKIDNQGKLVKFSKGEKND